MSTQLRRECVRLLLVDGCVIVIGLRTVFALARGERLFALVGFCLTTLGLVILTGWVIDWGCRVEIEMKWRK